MSRYTEALRWLYGLESRGVKLGLDRVAEAAQVRGNPEARLAVVHVGGSNGKGSVATLVESALRAAGYRTGQFASPHLHRYVERVKIDGRPIREAEVARRLESLRADDALPELTFFEYTTLLALEAFRDAACDVVVLEVGLGGRLDATNIVTPAVSVITNVSLEHQRILGDTVAKIAREKAGIIKPGVPCVVGVRGQEARRPVRRRLARQKAPALWIDRDFEATWAGNRLAARVLDRRWEGLHLGLRGRYQADNAACALGALAALQTQGYHIGDDAISTGFRRARWPGRLEVHRGRPAFLFDAAHNAAGCQTLAAHLEEFAPKGRVALLFGAMEDKDHAAMLRAFDGLVDRVVYVRPEMRRAADPSALRGIREGTIARSVRDGLSRAKRAAGPQGWVVVAGSIFVVAKARAIVKNLRSDPPIAM
ncbi:MAG: folylpolyglutamate synthase/dihydrofolate synthase family protein [Myxococcota bacterium]